MNSTCIQRSIEPYKERQVAILAEAVLWDPKDWVVQREERKRLREDRTTMEEKPNRDFMKISIFS